jgi:predicted transcriptional regulator
MARPKTAGPTERELEILRVLWDLGPSTVRDVFEELDRKSKTAYTSVLTIMLTMLEKGYVERDESAKSHVYRASYSKAQTEETLVKSFMDGVFGGSAMRLVTRALSVKGTSREESAKIRELLQRMEADHDGTD